MKKKKNYINNNNVLYFRQRNELRESKRDGNTEANTIKKNRHRYVEVFYFRIHDTHILCACVCSIFIYFAQFVTIQQQQQKKKEKSAHANTYAWIFFLVCTSMFMKRPLDFVYRLKIGASPIYTFSCGIGVSLKNYYLSKIFRNW